MGFAAVQRFAPDQSVTLFLLLCFVCFTLFVGPAIGTYVLPVLCYPQHLRGTFHGFSAAAAKTGAMLGALLFPIESARLGVTAVMLTQAAMCLTGALLCH